MKSNLKKSITWKLIVGGAVLAFAISALVTLAIKTRNSAYAQEAQTTFRSPADAAAALVKAAARGDNTELERILGVDIKVLLSTGDQQLDRAALESFSEKYNRMNRWVEMTDGTRVLYVGADNFAFPVPLAKNRSGKWYFDGIAGAEEIRARDIGRNELLAMDASSALASAEELYFTRSSDSAEYTPRIMSTPGKQDGLYWPGTEEENASPLAGLGELSKSSLASLSPDKPLVIDGYTVRILTAQGESAPGGSMNYIVDGKMSGGFAILATPVKYAETGIMTFMTGPDGTVYERDLGPDNGKIAASILAFNPTANWSSVE